MGYMMRHSWTPCIEFAVDGDVYQNVLYGPGYYDNRYWTMYKLPMFGCISAEEVIREIKNFTDEFSQANVRVIGFDSLRQVQTSGFIGIEQRPHCLIVLYKNLNISTNQLVRYQRIIGFYTSQPSLNFKDQLKNFKDQL